MEERLKIIEKMTDFLMIFAGLLILSFTWKVVLSVVFGGIAILLIIMGLDGLTEGEIQKYLAKQLDIDLPIFGKDSSDEESDKKDS